MKKLSVLFLCGWFPSRVSPTNGDFIERHALAVSKRHNVFVLHIITDKNLKKNWEISFEIKNGIKINIGYIKYTKNPVLKLFLFWKVFFEILKKIPKIDVVHLNEIYPLGLFALLLKWFKKKPFIISEHWTGYLEKSDYKISYLEEKTSKFIVKNAAFTCPVSLYLEKNMKSLGYKGNYCVIPNIVNTDNLFKPNFKTFKVLKLVHVSSLKDNHKNITGMLRVAKLLSEKVSFFEWNFIGNEGDEYKDYLNKLNLRNCNINFLPHQPHSSIVKYLQNATLCISFSNYETFGIVIPESIACGTPVISTKTGIAFDFNKEIFCKSISIGNEFQLLESILNYKNIFNDLNAAKMHSFVKERFSNDVVANKFSELYFKSNKS